PVLHGILTHGLPAPLQNVTIIIVHAQRDMNNRALFNPKATTKAAVLFDAWAVTMPNAWAPGEPLDLRATIGTLAGSGAVNAAISSGDKYLETITTNLGRSDQGDVVE